MMNKNRRTCWLPCLAVAALVSALAGCGGMEPPRFYPNFLKMQTNEILPAQQQEIALALTAMFGTPDDPFVLPESKLDLVKIRMAAGPVSSNQHGAQRGLYRRHCVHCHGTTGDGYGPTAAILNPYPRDYRQGVFKYKSTERPAKPTRDDLTRIIREGIMSTAMPSFALLQDDEIDALVEYVKYLSIRGQVEIRLIDAASELGDNQSLKLDHKTLVEEALLPVATKDEDTKGGWEDAESLIIAPPPRPEGDLAESIKIGQGLFYTKAQCTKCHGESALGDGQTTDYDDWNKPVFEAQN